MQITKKEFLNRMTTRPHVFMGITRRPVELDRIWETAYKIDELIAEQTFENPLLIRNAEKHSNHLRFSDGSRLYFDRGKYRFRDISFGSRTVLEVEMDLECACYTKYMYYYVLD